jgi:hypothetical protein
MADTSVWEREMVVCKKDSIGTLKELQEKMLLFLCLKIQPMQYI